VEIGAWSGCTTRHQTHRLFFVKKKTEERKKEKRVFSMGQAATKQKRSLEDTESLFDHEGKTAYEWNQEGVASKEDKLSQLDCYCHAMLLAPKEWLGYQNAGHICVSIEWYEGAVYFHEKVRELDKKYLKRYAE
jgi:hypothetical protein